MKIKLRYFILFITLVSLFSACDKQLDIAPKNIISNDQVFSNTSAITAYLASLYTAMPMEDFNFSANNGFNSWSSGNTTAHASGEAISCEPRGDVGDGTWWNWWANGYQTIRNLNSFINNIPKANLTADMKQAYLGEAMFIRAYDYFGLVKRYGGVPIIRAVQTFTGGNLDALQVPRNTEAEVYDFIASQLDSAALLLPATNERGRANKSVALAFKSRAMLFAGSIAKYGSVQINGQVGIPSSSAEKYFKAAFDAANAVIQSGKYSLYNAKPDKVDNFTSLFIETTNNPEVILVKDYHYPELVHSYDCWNLPFGVRGPWGYGSRVNPTLEMAEEYEYVDGTPGTLKLVDGAGKPIEYSDPTDLFKNKDPRCMATIIIPFGTFKGSVIDIQAGVIDDAASASNGSVYGRKLVTVGDYNQMYDANSHSVSSTGTQKIITINGIGGNERSLTGLYIRKYLNYNMDKSQAFGWNSTQSWIDIRYAEVLLNYAEAAIELGDVQDAKTAVNQIRTRAGIALLSDGEITRDRVRHERTVELAFENQHLWDIRRWHTADQLILNKKFSGILPYYDLQTHAYVFARGLVGNQLTFGPKLYYEQIPSDEIQRNPKLVQNPLY